MTSQTPSSPSSTPSSTLLLSLLNHCFPSTPTLPPLLTNAALLSLLRVDPCVSLLDTLKASLTSRLDVPYGEALENYKELAARGDELSDDEVDMLVLCYFTSRHPLGRSCEEHERSHELRRRETSLLPIAGQLF